MPARSGRSRRDREPDQDGPPEPEADPVEVARAICLRQLEFQPRTRAELASVLRRRGVPADAAEEVLGRFTEAGLIDDAAFAQAWVTSRHAGRGLARRALADELRRKGVEQPLIEGAVGVLDDDAEWASARALIEKRLPLTRGLPTQARMRRLMGLLARKGYPPALTLQVVRQALAEEGLDDRFADERFEDER